ncbi:MAG: LysR family transcriptional regulator [Rubricella sp.]
MKDDLPWSDIALFAAVARAGTLAGAARETGKSEPTLSRRMKALEARMNRRLFQHGAQGYRVTAEGRELLIRAERMEAASADIRTWLAARDGPIRVRISAGTWTAQHLAQNIDRYWSPSARWVPEFVQSNADLDIARREVDIGIRNRRPEQAWLAGRRTGVTRFAVYALDDRVEGWIGPTQDAQTTRSGRWVLDHHGGALVTTCNRPQLALSLALAGVGRIVLPTFVGRDTGLRQLSDPIAELDSEEWLVSHHEGRFEDGVRDALDALGRFLGRGKSEA